MRRVFVIACALALTTCSDTDDNGRVSDADADVADSILVLPDVTADDSDAAPDLTAPDGDAAIDTGGDGDATGECATAGGFGCPCSGNDDCLDELCIEGPDGNFCTRSCVTECAAGYECLNTSLGGSDPISICVPQHVRLCRPCEVAADCQSPLDPAAAACVPGPRPEDGSFCATSCAQGGCPEGFDCSDVAVGAGNARVCLPTDGTCECRPGWAGLGFTTSCARSNGEGTCGGTRSCTADGLTACSAPAPQAEVCDLQDEDCDGATDDVAPVACTIDNDFGSCPGTAACEDGAETCAGRAPAEERCNLVDDDCDGATDETFADCPAGSCSASDNGFVESGAPACTEGHCVYPSPHPCGQYVCEGDVCASACEDDSACVASAHCENNACVPDTTGGEACGEDRECASGHCQNGFCCEAGDCCQSVSDCPAGYAVAATCDDAATCQGTRKDAQCVASMCGTSAPVADDTACGAAVQALDCSPARPRFCTGGVDQVAPECSSGCGGDDECLAGFHCDGACVPDVGPGDACDEDTDCAEGVCADGVCCDDRCEGECRACDVAGSLGTCSEVPAAEDPDAECGGLACTGYYFGFVGKTCHLRAPVSDDGATCDGNGACLDEAAACAASGQGAASTACHEECQVPTANTCTGTTPGACTNVTGGPQTCGVGACQVTVDKCVGGAPQACVPGAPSDEVCDGVDNDCDGLTDADDDDLVLAPCENQKGVCAGAEHPADLCVGGNWAHCGADDYLDHDARYEPGHEVTCETTIVQLGVDNDCDGAVDDDFVYTSPAGTTIAGAAKPCGVGVCAGGLTVCGLAGLICSNDGNIAPETCNGLDDDCDNLADSLDNNASPLRTVACENQNGVCSGAMKSASLCSAGQWQPCTAETYTAFSTSYVANETSQCDGLDNDCDTVADDNLVPPNNSNQLGACAGTKKACTGPTGWVDSYSSVPGYGQDETPDASYADENCDGIDGDVDLGVFVVPAAQGGSDVAGCGTSIASGWCATVKYAVESRAAGTRSQVYVRAGTYVGNINLPTGVKVFGGYNGTWARAGYGTVGHEVRLQAAAGAAFESQYMTVRAINATGVSVNDLIVEGPDVGTTRDGNGRGFSSYAVYARSSTIELARVNVKAKSGASGKVGDAGTPASQNRPAQASSGQGATSGGWITCDKDRRAGGARATNSCGAGNDPDGGSGGDGGQADSSNADCVCVFGECACVSGCGATGGLSGAAADQSSGAYGWSGGGGGVVSPGGGGGPGLTTHGSGGGGATNRRGVLESFYWWGAYGNDGTFGQHGTGGGGGGGGSGIDNDVISVDARGAGGGGGGAGGCRAPAVGKRGAAGGGSFAVFAYQSTLTIRNSVIERASGGAGGGGGAGAAGQPGGLPGGGGAANADGGQAGGAGGAGGDGGHAGGGGGGAGGVAFSVFTYQGSFSNVSNTFSGGAGGTKGSGGTGPTSNQNGGAGVDGDSGDTTSCANTGGC